MKHTFEYKGYLGSAQVNVEDNLLHGRLLFITDVVNYAAETPQALETAFREAVDDYLQTCADLGDEANVPFKGTFNVRFTPEQHRDCALAAMHEDVSLNDWVKTACQSRLAHSKVVVHHHHHEVEVMIQSEETIAMDTDFGGFQYLEAQWPNHPPH